MSTLLLILAISWFEADVNQTHCLYVQAGVNDVYAEQGMVQHVWYEGRMDCPQTRERIVVNP